MEIDNLYTQEDLDEASLLKTLKKRYESGQIYTNAGLLLISINPYTSLNLHTQALMNLYRRYINNYNDYMEYEKNELRPHIYSIVNECISATKCNRSKYRIPPTNTLNIPTDDKYISTKSKTDPLTNCETNELKYSQVNNHPLDIKYRNNLYSIIVSGESGSGKTETVKFILDYLNIPLITSINLVIESFGNAKTVNNENSSRFGKLISLNSVISIETFLLERSRITNYLKEYNFHIFYVILAHYNITLVNDYIDTISFSKKEILFENYQKIIEAFGMIRIDFQLFEEVLLGIIYLGSLKINNNVISKDEYFYKVLEKLNIKEEHLENFLLYHRIVINNEVILKKNSDAHSTTLRDSIARLLYEELFNVLIKKINTFLAIKEIPEYNINILDIFGFENVTDENCRKYNGLDQFCINWCNEKIYDEFIKNTFEYEKKILEDEGIVELNELKNIKMKMSIIGIIEKRCGMVDIISEETLLNGGYESLGIKLKKILNIKLVRDDLISIKHYAGEIRYNIKDFISKNKEYGDLRELYHNEESNKDSKDGDDLNINKLLNEEILDINNLEHKTINVVKSFAKNMNNLFQRLYKTKIQYIKCIKPNKIKRAMFFEDAYVLEQLKSNGILQSVNLSKHLYSHNMFIDEFEEKYSGIPFEFLDIKKGKTRYFYNNFIHNALECLSYNMRKRNIENIKWLCKKYIEILKHQEKIENKNKLQEEENKCLIGEEEENKNKLPKEKNKSLIGEEENKSKLQEEENKNKLQEEENKCLIGEEEDNKNKLQKEEKKSKLQEEENKNKLREEDNKNKLQENKSKLQEQLQLKINELNKELNEKKQYLLKIDELENELIKYKRLVNKCDKCNIFEQKYKIQSQELRNKQCLEAELKRLRKRLSKYEDSEESSYEDSNARNIFACLVQLYVDYIPEYSNKDIPREEMVSMAHIVYFIVNNLEEDNTEMNLSVFIEEVKKRRKFEVECIAFLVSNLIELKILVGSELAKEVDEALKMFFEELCMLERRMVDGMVGYSILEYQGLSAYKEKESIYKKIFSGPTIGKLIKRIDYIYNTNGYYWISNEGIISIFSYLLSYVDFVVFNTLLVKKKRIGYKRIRQIEYNIWEIEKYCSSIGFGEGKYNLGFINEFIRIGKLVTELVDGAYKESIAKGGVEGSIDNKGTKETSTINMSEKIKEIVENSFLNPAQINALLNTLEIGENVKIEEHENYNKFIDEPNMMVPFTNEAHSENKLVKPKYLPDKSLEAIFKNLENL